MRRYYVAPVIGTGDPEGDPYRLKIPKGLNYVAVIPSNPDGTPKFAWGLALVNTVDHTAILADATIDAFPDKSLDDTLTVVQRNVAKNILSKRGIDTSFINSTTTFREIIQAIGKYLDANFNENRFDVME